MVVMVCFVGHDYQRILDGVNYWRSREPLEKIYLVYDRKRDKYGYASKLNADELAEALTFAGQRPELVSTNPQSYEEVFTALYRILRREVDEGKKVLIDATSTTKEAYGAVVTVSLMFPRVSIYVVPPAERGWYVPEPSAPGFEEWFQRVRSVKGLTPQEIYLPGFRLERLSEEEERVLMTLEEHGGRADSIKSLIQWCGEDPSSPAVKNKFSRLIDKLVEKGIAAEGPAAKTKPTSLTTFGRILAKALKHYYAKTHEAKPAPITLSSRASSRQA
ncbi:MAG: DUF6293 family protein [Candidatus Nezhaarchaeota archaeon]|nr:DUF6293 family protein [Candidatus Nezhaarchaeota archaeon]